ncbi:predicted protein [Arabidopsis lyrata subsp. lyrata]|uniref:Predicted protein n=1 Tax=Arabidopsis lyrata subsp. lyrata TaxID=81972 RepID=D7LX35_ARALL|nr:predicted protein [Arabidopsis lyrata subsp. lyrata]
MGLRLPTVAVVNSISTHLMVMSHLFMLLHSSLLLPLPQMSKPLQLPLRVSVSSIKLRKSFKVPFVFGLASWWC